VHPAMVAEIPVNRHAGITPVDSGVLENRDQAGDITHLAEQLAGIMRGFRLGDDKRRNGGFEAEKPGAHAFLALVWVYPVMRGSALTTMHASQIASNPCGFQTKLRSRKQPERRHLPLARARQSDGALIVVDLRRPILLRVAAERCKG